MVVCSTKTDVTAPLSGWAQRVRLLDVTMEAQAKELRALVLQDSLDPIVNMVIPSKFKHRLSSQLPYCFE